MRIGNGQRMPWPVRIALGWFVLLAIACCAPLVYLQSQWLEGWGLGWMLWQHVVGIGFIALGAGFVLGILRGGRDWVAAPYFLIGLLVFFMPLTGFRKKIDRMIAAGKAFGVIGPNGQFRTCPHCLHMVK